MLKAIKVNKRMRLDELIKYVRENRKTLFKNRVGITFSTKNNNEVIFYHHGELTLDNWISSVDLFEVEVIEEITEDTEFEKLIYVESDGSVYKEHNTNVKIIMSKSIDIIQILAFVDGIYVDIWESED